MPRRYLGANGGSHPGINQLRRNITQNF